MTILEILNEIFDYGLDTAEGLYKDNKKPNAKKIIKFLKRKEKEMKKEMKNEI